MSYLKQLGSDACMVLVWACGSTNVQADDLLDVYRKAQNRDTVLAAARYAAEVAQEKLPQALAGLLPVVSVSSNTNRQAGATSFSAAPYVERQARNLGTTVQLTQPVFRAVNWLAYEQADAQVRQAMAQYFQVQQELILRVSQSYFDVLVAKESVAVATFQLNAVDQQLDLAKRNFAVGTSTVTDVYEAKSRHDLSRAQRISALNELEVKTAEMERILGEAPTRLSVLRKDIDLPALQATGLDIWLTNAQSQHPLVRIQQAARDAAEKEISKNNAAHLPTLDFTASNGGSFASGSISSPADISTRSRMKQLGLQLTIPIYAGGGLNSKVREAIASLGKAESELDGARRQAIALVRQAYAGIANGHAQTEALLSAVESSKSSVSANKIGYKIGTRINIDVLNAEQQLYVAQRDLAKSRADTLMSGLRLKATTGSLDESDLQALNNLLEPVAALRD